MVDRSFLDWPFFVTGHQRFAERLEAWCASELPPEPNPMPPGALDGTSRELVRALGDAGWLLPTAVDPEDPATRLDVRTLCLARETLARHGGLADLAFAMQGLGTGAISLAGTPAQKRRWLPETTRGRAIAAFALSEAKSGSDVAQIDCRAVRDGTDWVLDGEKMWISNGGIADVYTLFARTGGPGAKGLSAFIVPADTPGFEIAERLDVIAPHPMARLQLVGVRLPKDALLGEEGRGFQLAMSVLDVFRSTVGAAALGFARHAYALSVERARNRSLFGETLGDLQMVQGHLADMALDIDASALLIYRAAYAKDRGAERISREAAMAKLYATEAAQRVVDAAVQLHGGDGVRVGHPVEALYREVRALRIYEGASDVQKVIIARHALR